MRSSLALLSAVLVWAVATAFVPLASFGVQQRRQSAPPLWLASDSNDAYQDAQARNKARTDVRILLMQRALQSFMFLCTQCRDPHTITWLEGVLETNNLGRYHGTGALNMTRFGTWDTVLTEIMSQPMCVLIVRAKRRGKGQGGWSKNNPYLEERFVEFEIDIDPVSLASRIISVREQLAKEWAHDLEVLITANDNILDSYHSRVLDERDEEEDEVDSLTAPYSEKKPAYDRYPLSLGDSAGIFSATAPSPLRAGNFDLLVLLATQESVHRVLRQYQEAGEKERVAFEWLREFYSDRAKQYFDGEGEYGRADDFLDELLLTPPSVKKIAEGKADLIDPLRIAEDIIRTRTEVGIEWQEIVTNVPEDHTELRRVLFEKQMLKWGHKDEGATQGDEEEVVETKIIEMGEFE